MRNGILLCAMALVFAAPLAHAGDRLDGLEMDVMQPDETPQHAVSQIALPQHASTTGATHSAFGLQTANDARENGGANGQDVSEQARDGHGSNGQSVAEQARQHQPEHPTPPDHPHGRP
jgi:hypothetical protein